RARVDREEHRNAGTAQTPDGVHAFDRRAVPVEQRRRRSERGRVPLEAVALRDFGERSEVAFGDSVARRPQVVSLSGDPGGIVRRGLGGPLHAAARAYLLLTLRRYRVRDLERPIGAAEQRLGEAVGAVGRTTRVHLDEAAEYRSGGGARATAREHADLARRTPQIERGGDARA